MLINTKVPIQACLVTDEWNVLFFLLVGVQNFHAELFNNHTRRSLRSSPIFKRSTSARTSLYKLRCGSPQRSRASPLSDQRQQHKSANSCVSARFYADETNRAFVPERLYLLAAG